MADSKRWRWCLALAALVGAAAPVTGAAQARPGAAASQLEHGYEWKPVRIGGGGYVTGLGAADDGTLVGRVDVYGAYVLERNALQWRQLLTAASLPEEWRLPKMGKGVQAIAVAPSDSSRIYVAWAGHVLVTSDRGRSWTETAFAPANWDANGAFGRGFGDKLVVDPADPDVVYVGTPDAGLRRSTDAGATWTDTSVPAGRDVHELVLRSGGEVRSVGITGLAVDRSVPPVEGRSPVVYAASWGHGVFRSVDAGATWTLLEDSPRYVVHAGIDDTGVYYVLDGDADGPFTIQRFDGAWSDVTPADWRPWGIGEVENPFLAVDQDATGRVVAGWSMQMFRTSDGGEGWDRLTWADGRGDVRWADSPGDENPYLVASDLVFDPTRDHRLWLATGSGVQFTTLTDSGELVWSEKTKGMETMVATDVASTVGGPPVFGVFDFGTFGGSTRLDSFALKKGPVPYFSGTTSVDASPFTKRFAVTVTTDYVQYGKWPINAAYTTNGGARWVPFPSLPGNAATAADFGYGTIAVSTADNMVWAPGRYFFTRNTDFRPWYTTDRGRSWQPVSLPGVTSYPQDSIGGFMFGRNRQTIAADQVRKGVFYLYMLREGLFRTTDGGATWTRMHDGDFSRGDPAFTAVLKAMPGKEGTLYYTDGPAGGHDLQGPQRHGGFPFLRSVDGGATWGAVPGVDKVLAFGFGKAAPASPHATIYVAGDVEGEYGIWRSTDNAGSWTRIGEFPYVVDTVTTVSGDANTFGLVYVGFGGSSYVYGKPAPNAATRRAPATTTTAPPTTAPAVLPSVTTPSVPVPTVPAPGTTAAGTTAAPAVPATSTSAPAASTSTSRPAPTTSSVTSTVAPTSSSASP